jgi:hypothetical protein
MVDVFRRTEGLANFLSRQLAGELRLVPGGTDSRFFTAR